MPVNSPEQPVGTPALETVGGTGILPVVVIDDPDAAAPLAETLLQTGLSCVEVTLRTRAGQAAIRALARYPELLVGAGTVLDVAQADMCVEAGARFVVSPGFDRAVVEHCLELGVPVLPGVATPSEMLQARSYGLGTVKFFPAEQAGGLAFLDSVTSAIADLRFVPTGGIGARNAGDYLAKSYIAAVGGSWMVPRALLAAGAWEDIRRLCAEAAAVAADRRRGGTS